VEEIGLLRNLYKEKEKRRERMRRDIYLGSGVIHSLGALFYFVLSSIVRFQIVLLTGTASV
jgi:hypothetical protein